MDGMPESMSMPLYKCPRCGDYPGGGQKHNAYITANDGGNIACFKCGCLHHMCVNGIRVGSPGPALCPHCAGSNRQIQYNSPAAPVQPSQPVEQTTHLVPQKPQLSAKRGEQPASGVDMRLPYSVRSTFPGYK
jgi:hypothetical protein